MCVCVQISQIKIDSGQRGTSTKTSCAHIHLYCKTQMNCPLIGYSSRSLETDAATAFADPIFNGRIHSCRYTWIVVKKQTSHNGLMQIHG